MSLEQTGSGAPIGDPAEPLRDSLDLYFHPSASYTPESLRRGRTIAGAFVRAVREGDEEEATEVVAMFLEIIREVSRNASMARDGIERITNGRI